MWAVKHHSRGSRQLQTNPFIHDVNQHNAHSMRVAKLVMVAGRMPDVTLEGFWDGGARRDRTDDLKLAKLALSQLSYGPGQASRH